MQSKITPIIPCLMLTAKIFEFIMKIALETCIVIQWNPDAEIHYFINGRVLTFGFKNDVSKSPVPF